MNHDGLPENTTATKEIQIIRNIQIISAALIFGVAIFAVIVIAQVHGKPAGANPVITYPAVGVAVLMFLAKWILPGIIVRLPVQQPPAPEKPSRIDETDKRRRLLATYQARMIAGMAMLEGAAFFCLVAYFLEATPLALAAAAGLWVAMIVGFPTRTRVENWVDNQLQLVDF